MYQYFESLIRISCFRELKIPGGFCWSGCHFNVGKLEFVVLPVFQAVSREKINANFIFGFLGIYLWGF